MAGLHQWWVHLLAGVRRNQETRVGEEVPHLREIELARKRGKTPARIALVPLAALFAALVVARRERGESPVVTAGAALYFPLVHAAFALGLVRGWVSGTVVLGYWSSQVDAQAHVQGGSRPLR